MGDARRGSAESRFWPKVNKRGPRHHLAHSRPYRGRCWLWTGARKQNGYGQFNAGNGRNVRAHRFAYGPVPRGLELDHLCRHRACVRPSHSEPVTHAENIRRGDHQNRRKTRCWRGHPLSGANLYTYTDGRRKCRACERERYQASKAGAA